MQPHFAVTAVNLLQEVIKTFFFFSSVLQQNAFNSKETE